MKRIIALLVILCMFLFVGCSKNKKYKTVNTTTNAYSVSSETTIKTITTTQKENLPLEGKTICIDAGHGIYSNNYKEKLAPNISETKDAYAVGTKGISTGITEESLNLIVAKKLQTKLQSLGATVIMTRETSHSQMSNIDRAQFANKHNADLSIKIHANGSENSKSKGVLMMVPSAKYISESVVKDSKKAGELILKHVLTNTNAKSLGTQEFSNMTGFNWSTVPIIMLEMGFMTNTEEDQLLNSNDYQNKIVNGIADGLIECFSN